MKRFLKYAALIATVLMICSSAWAYDGTDHIAVSPGNEADGMIFPWFLALDGGWNTKLTVINTDQVNSVVAKVAIISPKNSQEVLDFLIYLSPADVWTGSIYYSTQTATVNIYSSDDSIVTDTTPTFATVAKPVNESMGALKCSSDTTSFGYVKVIMSAYGPVKASSGLVGPGVAKSSIYGLYTLLASSTTGTVTSSTTGTLKVGSENVLAGYMEFNNPLLGLSTTYRATGFMNYDNRNVLGVRENTIFGQYSNSSYAEIEAALAKNNLAMPYVSGDDTTYHILTFPLKRTNYTTCDAVTTSDPFFKQNASTGTCLAFQSRTYDLMENSKATPFSGKGTTTTLCWEVNVLTPVTYPEGWAWYNFVNYNTGLAASTSDYTRQWINGVATDNYLPITYAGAPVIASYMYLGVNGLSGEYASWADSNVSVNGTSYPQYHYSFIKTP